MAEQSRVQFYLYETPQKQVGRVIFRMTGGEPEYDIFGGPREAIRDLLWTYGIQGVFVSCVDGTPRGAPPRTRLVRHAIKSLWAIHQEHGVRTLSVGLEYTCKIKEKNPYVLKEKLYAARKERLQPGKKRGVSVLWKAKLMKKPEPE